MEDKTHIITVDSPHLPVDKFEMYLEATRKGLVTDANQRSDFFRANDGEKLEPIVFEQMCSLASDFNLPANSIRQTPKQHFPDIVAQNFHGIEVKSTRSDSWSSIGSSVVESLRDSHANKIYIMFGKLSKKAIKTFLTRTLDTKYILGKDIFDLTFINENTKGVYLKRK